MGNSAMERKWPKKEWKEKNQKYNSMIMSKTNLIQQIFIEHVLYKSVDGILHSYKETLRKSMCLSQNRFAFGTQLNVVESIALCAWVFFIIIQRSLPSE